MAGPEQELMLCRVEVRGPLQQIREQAAQPTSGESVLREADQLLQTEGALVHRHIGQQRGPNRRRH